MADKLIMEVFVELEPEHVVGFSGRTGTVKMLPFTGKVKGEIFKGVVAPGGVDTQVTNAVGVRHMSARYMLAGEDMEGKPCHIYVDNEGWFTNGEQPKPFTTVPTFLTDSECLAPYLHQNIFRGEGHPGERGPIIKFYEITKT